jgi:hypothetical protein
MRRGLIEIGRPFGDVRTVPGRVTAFLQFGMQKLLRRNLKDKDESACVSQMYPLLIILIILLLWLLLGTMRREVSDH